MVVRWRGFRFQAGLESTDIAPGAIGRGTNACWHVVVKGHRHASLGGAGYEAGEQAEDAE